MKTLLYILGLFALNCNLMAQGQLQSVIANAGGYNILSPDLNVTWTVGEAVVQTISSENVLTQGFHQPFPEGYLSINDPGIKDLTMSIYPNPANSVLFLVFESDKNLFLNVEIYNVQGQELTTFDFNTSNHIYSVDLENYSSGMYYASIAEASTGNKLIFKFVKQ